MIDAIVKGHLKCGFAVMEVFLAELAGMAGIDLVYGLSMKQVIFSEQEGNLTTRGLDSLFASVDEVVFDCTPARGGGMRSAGGIVTRTVQESPAVVDAVDAADKGKGKQLDQVDRKKLKRSLPIPGLFGEKGEASGSATGARLGLKGAFLEMAAPAEIMSARVPTTPLGFVGLSYGAETGKKTIRSATASAPIFDITPAGRVNQDGSGSAEDNAASAG